MNNKSANIDLLFRNGLKDYEVLPPQGVWEGIKPSVKIKSKPVVLIRVAAVVSIMLSVSFLTYKWSTKLSVNSLPPDIAFNLPVFTPLTSGDEGIIKYVPQSEYNRLSSSEILGVESADNSEGTDEMINTNKTERMVFREQVSFSTTGSQSLRKPSSGYADKSFSDESTFSYPGLQYIPENVSKKQINRWSVAAMASPTYYSSFNSGRDAFSKQLSTSEQPLVSYSGGLVFSYKISKRFSLQSGLYYSSLGQRVDGINSYSGFQPYSETKGDHNFEVLTSNGTVFTNNPDIFLTSEGLPRVLTAYTLDIFDPDKANLQPISNSIDQNFCYLELPVILKYKILDKTLGINLIGGVSYNLLVRNSAFTTVNGSRYTVGETKGLNPLTLSSSIGMGMEYTISEKLSLNLEPTFRYYLNPFSVTTSSYIHPYSFGIFSGVSYKF